MNLAGLQTFLAVVRTGNLNKAAEQLNVTQSTVTARLDQLEAELGQQLLIRARRGAQLTKAGFSFQRHAELMARTWDQAVKAVGLPKGFSGLFSLACQGDLWEGAVDRWVSGLQAREPGLALEVWPGDLGDIRRWLGSGLVDAAFTLEPVAGDGLATREARRERLVLVASAPRAAQGWDPAYVFVDLGPEFRRQHSLAWPGDETAHMTFGSSRWALDYLIAKGGSAYLPWRLAEAPVAASRLHLVREAPEFSRAIHLTWRETALAGHPWLTEAADWL